MENNNNINNISDDEMQQIISERFMLARQRIADLSELSCETDSRYSDYFLSNAREIEYCLGIYDELISGAYYNYEIEALKEINTRLFRPVLKENYGKSYSDPDYAEEKLDIYAGYLSFIDAELRYLPQLVFDRDILNITALLELFLEIYGLFCMDKKPTISSVEEAVFFYAFDYVEDFTAARIQKTFLPAKHDDPMYKVVMDSDLKDLRYLYNYGEYISSNEIRLAEYLNILPDEEIERAAAVYTSGFRRGFEVMRVDFEGKKTVGLRYHIGQERIVRAAVKQFREMGLEAAIFRYSVNRISRRGVVKQGFEGTSPNMQFEYDHRMDEALFLDGRFSDRKVNATRAAYKSIEDRIGEYAGPAVIESFGEELFNPEAKNSVTRLSAEQMEISVDMNRKLGMIGNEFLPSDCYSFTIIAFPIPEIGDDFEEIFKETMVLNTLDNDTYTAIQQSIIDVLDKAEYVEVKGSGANRTDMHVSMRKLEKPDKQTQFENCVADVNIPVGEVFTSPVLKGTEGVLNVSSAYLNGYYFKDIELHFKDGVVTDYSCANYEGEEGLQAGKNYIKENILFNHEFLPIGEFAIGTNTTAYRMAQKFGILQKMPILIVEKTGPHFAVGDTCYSHAEDKAVYNPDGKEIISRENDFSLLRDTEPEKAYFNCHTDITIPYNEIERITAVNVDGSDVDIIRDGRFVLKGTELLNKALDD